VLATALAKKKSAMEPGENDSGQAQINASVFLFAGLLLLGMFIGSPGAYAQENQSWTPVPISDISMVAGEWKGMVKENNALLPEGPVHLTIRENGTYMFVGERMSDVVLGAGFLEIRDGRMSGDTDRRVATFALNDRRGETVLVVDATAKQSGKRYHGELTRAE
jgi:hypothetical protein